jgi:hypothetical protein
MSRVEEAVNSRDGSVVGRNTTVAQRGSAYICFAVSAAAVLYGLYILIPQFH